MGSELSKNKAEIRSFQDEMDKLDIEQLHRVTLQLSKNCFEIKKLCLTLLISAEVLIISFTSKHLDLSTFIGAAIIIIFFYLLDVQSYYYQERTRIRMHGIAKKIAERETCQTGIAGVGLPIGERRLKANRLLHAFVNPSMFFYGVLIFIDCVLLTLYEYGLIQSNLER